MHPDAAQHAVGEAGRRDGMRACGLVSSVDVDLTGAAVVGAGDNRSPAGGAVRHGVLPRQRAKPRQLVARAVEQVCKRAARCPVLLAVREDAAVVAERRRRIVERRHRRQRRGAEPCERGPFRRLVPTAGRDVPCRDLLDQIFAGQHREIRRADDPFRHEGSLRAVRAPDAGRRAELVVHEHGKCAIAVVECPEAVGQAHHPISVQCGIACRQYRLGDDTRHGPDDVGSLRAGRAARRVRRQRGRRDRHCRKIHTRFRTNVHRASSAAVWSAAARNCMGRLRRRHERGV